jgi:hypothetical protein
MRCVIARLLIVGLVLGAAFLSPNAQASRCGDWLLRAFLFLESWNTRAELARLVATREKIRDGLVALLNNADFASALRREGEEIKENNEWLGNEALFATREEVEERRLWSDLLAFRYADLLARRHCLVAEITLCEATLAGRALDRWELTHPRHSSRYGGPVPPIAEAKGQKAGRSFHHRAAFLAVRASR